MMNVAKEETVIVVNLTSCTVEFDQTRGGFVSVSAEEQTEHLSLPAEKLRAGCVQILCMPSLQIPL